ncbi:uncharacterized protein F5891DRAFT_1176122 [Suillus fuscotomentosus]|uniref:AMP-dependent synthetase/ligase domain-containing protein n=1 Tax=Suillus fuscotomentosus TaxID=1912939 RepID=A0AAD4HG92_9AGAM|nr:uncharacterized protein F5891DRAFT_1176122 [Suillus fuscotomentosus]KAG1894389.1 hypothetical protein F5891DRAFT_1176122 [Suillus fuscotomentosus]
MSATQTSQLQIDEIPALKHLYHSLVSGTPNVAIVPYPSLGPPSSDNDVLFYLHSSGSTGFPKPILISNLTAIHWCLTLSVYPPTSFLDPLAILVVPNSHNIMDSVLKTKPNTLVVVLVFLEQWAFSLSVLRPSNMFSMVAVLLHLRRKYPEFGTNTCTIRNSVDQKFWDWVRFGPNSKIRWAPQDDSTYECQVLTTQTHQVSVENLPDVKGYATSDVFIKHPTIDLD